MSEVTPGTPSPDPVPDGDAAAAANGDAGKEIPAVPYARFREVNESKKAAEARVRELEEQMAASTRSPSIPSELPDAPDNLTERQRVEWLIQDGLKRNFNSLVKERFGAEPKEIQGVLGMTREVAQQAAERHWADLCKTHGLDPTNETLRSMTSGVMRKANVPPEKALEQVVGFLGAGRGNPVADAISEGLSGAITVEDALPSSAAEASAWAAKGRAVRHHSAEEVFAKKDAEARRGMREMK